MAESATPGVGVFLPERNLVQQDTAALTSVRRYFEFSSFLLLASGFLTVALTGALDIPSVSIVGMALLVRGWFLLKRRAIAIPPSWDSILSIGYLVFYAADLFLLSGSFVPATVHLVLFAMVVKVFSVRRDRDHLYLAVLAFLQVLAASVLTVDTIFVVALAVFLFLAVNTLVAFELQRSWSEARRDGMHSMPRYHDAPLLSRLSGLALAMGTFILLLGAALFFVLPRATGGYMGRFSPANSLVSGFSESVRLGQIGRIQQSNSVVMHVQIDGDNNGRYDLKWRGIALTLFDGTQWFNPLQRILPPELGPGEYDIRTADRRRYDSERSEKPHRIRYRVLLEPIGTNVFFLAAHPMVLRGRYLNISMDEAGSVFSGEHDHLIGSYTAVSDLSKPPENQLRAAGSKYPSDIAIHYLQLPKLDPRVRRLAEQIAAPAPDNYDKAEAISRYLQANYGYTLQLSDTTPADPLADFLFERKKGHCEYFASAMAVMLRVVGIPSRIVNGFRGGEFNDITGSYIVRARDAHSWVEAYFPGSGWVTFDPTPAGALPESDSRVGLYLDAMHEFWREWIVNYDLSHQRRLGESAAANAASAFTSSRRWARARYFDLLMKAWKARASLVRSPKGWVLTATLVIIVAGILLSLGKLRRALRRRALQTHPERAPDAAAALWYRRMEEAAARLGWRRVPSQTPDEFHAHIQNDSLRRLVEHFTDCYQRARFASSAADAAKLPSLYEAIRQYTPPKD